MIYSAEDAMLDTAKRIMVDSNILIAFFNEKHKLYEKVYQRLNPIYLKGAEFYLVQPCLLELKEYWRRKMITECIELRREEGFHFFKKFRKTYEAFAFENSRRNLRYLNDSQLKELRSTLENVSKGIGLTWWIDLCNQALCGRMLKLEELLKQSRFIYASFNDNNVFPIEKKSIWPKWEDADLLFQKFGLAYNDAAILNMLNSANSIDSFISNDGDMLFAIANGAIDSKISPYTFLDISLYQ